MAIAAGTIRRTALALLLGTVFASSAFAQERLDRFRCMMTGSWDNFEQAEHDTSANKPMDQRHERRAMTYIPVQNDNIEGQLFGILSYGEEGFSGPLGRLAMHRFRRSDAENAILHEFFFLNDKGKWGDDVLADLERLTSISEQDVRINQTCAMRWRWTGDRFVGATNKGQCLTSSFTENTILVEGYGELSAETLLRHDQNFDTDGNRLPVQGSDTPELFKSVGRDVYLPSGLKSKIEQVSASLSCD